VIYMWCTYVYTDIYISHTFVYIHVCDIHVIYCMCSFCMWYTRDVHMYIQMYIYLILLCIYIHVIYMWYTCDIPYVLILYVTYTWRMPYLFRKRALWLVALLRTETYNLKVSFIYTCIDTCMNMQIVLCMQYLRSLIIHLSHFYRVLLQVSFAGLLYRSP